MRKLILALALAAVWTLSGCKKTGEGQYEVEKPTVGTTTDTVNTPSVETGTVKDTITVPKVETEKKEVEVPKVQEAERIELPSSFALLSIPRYIAETRGTTFAGLLLTTSKRWRSRSRAPCSC